MQMAIIIHQVLKHHRTDNMILSAQTGVSEGGAESLFIRCGAARASSQHFSASALIRSDREESELPTLAVRDSHLKLVKSCMLDNSFQGMDSDADCCHFG